MDFNLKQCKYEPGDEEEEEHETKPKFPKHHHHHDTITNNSNKSSPHYTNSTLPLFLHPPLCPNFSKGQWQELELQALIYRHMIAGADVPPHLLAHLLQNTIISPYYHTLSPYYQPPTTAMLQSGYWGKGAMDPEPGRCRRTDGKKWRCSRDVVTGQKYCERHVHRGKNRSRKPVEIPASGSGGGGDAFQNTKNNNNNLFTLSGPSLDLLHHINSSRPLNNSIDETKCTFEEGTNGGQPAAGNRTLRRFFDDWPRSLDNTDSDNNKNTCAAATNLSISMPGNSSSSSLSDFSLKLGTGGDGDEGRGGAHAARDRPQMSWGMAWEANRRAGGPLAEALRSSMTSPSFASPKSVLLQHQLTRSSASETSYV